MSRDVITVGSTMQIPLLHQGEYSQLCERFMNYLEEQTNGEAMINSIKNGEHPLPVITQVSLAGTTSNIDRLARSLLIQGLLNDIYSLIDNNNSAKDFWDALKRHMLGSEYGEQDRKDAVLYEYETFKATEGELDDEDISDLKKITALLAKAFNQKKYYAKPTKNNLRTSSTSTLANKKPEYVKSEEKKEDKKDDGKKRDMSKVKCYIARRKDILPKIARKQSVNMVFMAKMEKILSDSEESSSSAEETIIEVSYYSSDFENLDTYSSVRRPKHSGVIWKKKGSSNTSCADLSSFSNSNVNKNVKRYSRKDLSSCNNSHHVNTRSTYACNDAMNVSCNSRLHVSFDVNDLFFFKDVSIRNSRVSKMPFRKKPRDSLHVRSKNNSNNFLPRTLFRWLPKMQSLAEPIAKRIPKVKRQIDKISKTPNSTGPIFKQGLEVAFRKSTCFVRNEDGVDFLTGDHSSNLYTIALNDITLNSSVCLLAKASSSQYWLWHQRKIHRKHHKSKTDFASNKPLYLLHMDLWGPMRVELINGKRYVLSVVNDYSRYTWVLFLRSKDEVAEVIISFIKKTQVNLQLQVKRGRTDNGTEFKNKTLAKFFDEVRITQ
ncbi:putative ribonuclease H-like domain-containing protein [Tanacetum coccineum]